MSLLAKMSLATAAIVSAGIVGYVHIRQYLDRSYLHEGIIKDIQNQQKRKAENLHHLQLQADITKRLKQNQESARGD